MKKYFYPFLICIALVQYITGCDNPVDIANQNAESVKNPVTVATIPDGRILHRIEIKIPDSYSHYVYYFTYPNSTELDTNTISNNYTTQLGKTHYNQTVILDGHTFELVPKD